MVMDLLKQKPLQSKVLGIRGLNLNIIVEVSTAQGKNIREQGDMFSITDANLLQLLVCEFCHLARVACHAL